MNRTLSIMGISAVLATLLIGIAGAISTSGACHGAFANTNGNFGTLGLNNGAGAQSIGGGVPAGAGAAGYDNSAVSGDCTLPSS